MARHLGPTRWAVGRFGRDAAAALTELIPEALQDAVGRQIDAQQMSRVKTLHPFGGAWPARYEALVEHLQDVPGVQVVKPYGRSFEVVLVNNVVLLPFEYAKSAAVSLDDRRVMSRLNKMTLELLEQYGPEPTYHQPSFEGLPTDEPAEGEADRPELLRGLTPDGVVILFYAADPRQGLLRVGWGEVAIGIGRKPMWRRAEDLALPTATHLPGMPATARFHPEASPRRSRFDDAPLPAPIISPRSAAERFNLDPVTAEPQQEVPLGDEQG